MTWLLLLIRLFLGVVFVFYGIVKVLGGQFHHGDFLLDSHTVDGTTMVWTFFGYSPIYGSLIGLAEMGAGLLLLIPKTKTLGALLLLPIAANITVMDFCFDFPAVKYTALTFLILDLILLSADYRKLRSLFTLLLTDDKAAQSPVTDAREKRKIGKVGYAAIAAAGLILIPFLTNALMVSVTAGPEQAAYARCVGKGFTREDLQLLRSRTTGWAGINMQGFVEISVKGKPTMIHVSVYRPHGFTPWQATDESIKDRDN
jgi:uncharacterized membrane protein YphA (DoxX/SURF4 family)